MKRSYCLDKGLKVSLSLSEPVTKIRKRQNQRKVRQQQTAEDAYLLQMTDFHFYFLPIILHFHEMSIQKRYENDDLFFFVVYHYKQYLKHVDKYIFLQMIPLDKLVVWFPRKKRKKRTEG
jgi:hypothetical protein